MNPFDPEYSPAKTSRPAIVTYLLCGACVLMFLWQMMAGANTRSQLAYPGYVDGLEIWQGAWWGLLICFFLHGNFYHVAFNVFWLYRFGTAAEPHLGSLRFLLFWVAGTAVSSLFELAISGNTGIGASGFVYALFGLIWVGGKGDPELARIIDPQVAVLFIVWLFLCIALTWSGVWAIANGAHFSGFFFGAACAYACIVRPEPWLKSSVAIVTVLLFLTLLYAPWSSNWNLAQGLKAYGKGNYEKALAYFDRVNSSDYLVFTTEMRADVLSQLGRAADSVAAYKLLFLNAQSDLSQPAYADNQYAWILATAPDDKLRNPAEAIRYAQMACETENYQDADDLDTLAAAYASAGQFDQAVTWEQKAIGADADAHALDELKDHLKLFQAHQPYRDTSYH